MQYKVLATDLDNTLVPFGEPCPSPAVVKAIRDMQKQGVKFVISTGRCYATMNNKTLLGGLRWDYAICCNGAEVMDANGKPVYEHPLTHEEMYALVDYCEDYDYCLHFSFHDGYYCYVNYASMSDYYAQMENTGLSVKDGEDQNRHLIDMPCAAFALLPKEGGLAGFQEKYGYLNLHFMHIGSSPDGAYLIYDIVRDGTDKATGLAGMCEAIGVTLAQTVTAGDSGNDCGMLRAAGLGCAMGNATQEAKEAADIVIGDVRKDGLASLIHSVWLDGEKIALM
ncbi:MAG: HAD family hydrolase [Faecalibacterium sp.]